MKSWKKLETPPEPYMFQYYDARTKDTDAVVNQPLDKRFDSFFGNKLVCSQRNT